MTARRHHQPGDCLHQHAVLACRSCCARLGSISVDLFDKSIRPKLREHHIGDALRFDVVELKACPRCGHKHAAWDRWKPGA